MRDQQEANSPSSNVEIVWEKHVAVDFFNEKYSFEKNNDETRIYEYIDDQDS